MERRDEREGWVERREEGEGRGFNYCKLFRSKNNVLIKLGVYDCVLKGGGRGRGE